VPIHTVAPDKPEYVRIVKSGSPYNNRVGKVVAEGDHSNITLIFVKIIGEPSDLVFNKHNLKYLTEKEYFVGALGGK